MNYDDYMELFHLPDDYFQAYSETTDYEYMSDEELEALEQEAWE